MDPIQILTFTPLHLVKNSVFDNEKQTTIGLNLIPEANHENIEHLVQLHTAPPGKNMQDGVI